MLTDANIRRAAEWISQAKSVVVLTGAGVSAESGLTTFRAPEEGMWSKYDPMELATIDAFNRDPELVTRWYHWRFTKALDVEPNPGHAALANLQRWLDGAHKRFTLITQNVDGLHQRAGSTGVIEIHGSILRWRCTETGEEMPLTDVSFETFPVPSEAGGLMRPCVVWFGEMLPPEAIEGATAALSSCDVFLSIGTSATVYPAAGFIEIARTAGAKTIEVNRDPTPIGGGVDRAIAGQSGVVLPHLVELLKQMGDGRDELE